MRLRVRLIVAFLLLSVVPLGAVTIYSYVANYRALQVVTTREANQLAAELSQRMQLVTAQLSERVEHLMDMSAATEAVEQATARVEAPTPKQISDNDPTDLDLNNVWLKGQAADALGAAAMLLNSVELRGTRGPGGGGGRGRSGPPRAGQIAQGQSGRRDNAGPGRGLDQANPPAAGAAPASGLLTTQQAIAAPVPAAPPAPSTPPALMTFGQGGREAGSRLGPDPRFVGPRLPGEGSVPGTLADGAGRGRPPLPPLPPGVDESDRIRIDVGPIARDVMRSVLPEGSDFNALTPEQRQRVTAEISQRMMGINEGLKLAAAELQRKADEVRRKEEADAKAAAKQKPATPAPMPMKRRTALTGSKLAVTLEQNGKVVRTASAEVNLPNMLMTVFSSMPTGQGEVPFAVGRDGRIYTTTDANRATIEPLGPARLPDGASMVREWIVVTTPDPTGSDLRLGIARPVGDSLAELRRTAGRNAALGLGFIGLSIALIVPLSGRLTRNLSTLTGAVRRIAQGEYATRVHVKSKDEIGELAGAFNQMATDVEAHQRAIVGQERLKRELELGRQIQHDMQPQQPLRLGLTEIQGVSVPAREVGGDFFNYFALPDGQVALLVGDVSGKGVGAALLMANIQASLRTRFALGQDLSAIVDAIDRDIEVNSPGPMYATMFVGILDPATRRLRYVNAGHHPQYILRMSGEFERMSATGLPAGILAGRGYIERQLQLELGDVIFFYTDGCPETENAQEEMFGSNTLETLLQSAKPGSPADLLQRVETALKEFRGTREPFDDATMMAVRVG